VAGRRGVLPVASLACPSSSSSSSSSSPCSFRFLCVFPLLLCALCCAVDEQSLSLPLVSPEGKAAGGRSQHHRRQDEGKSKGKGGKRRSMSMARGASGLNHKTSTEMGSQEAKREKQQAKGRRGYTFHSNVPAIAKWSEG
jgi:hypothetical protein